MEVDGGRGRRAGTLKEGASKFERVWSTVTPLLRVDGDEFHPIFCHAPQPEAPPAATLTMEHRAGLPTVRITLPPAGFAIYQAASALHRLGPHPRQDLKPWVENAWHGGMRPT